eukprot:GEMP01027043.1.p1 GENE.GEMP01027043.1~~GEMP01027043.1.p1  ORF type:complete len:553 (-),score=113.27 GEMP01027043.1:687-2318(-)
MKQIFFANLPFTTKEDNLRDGVFASVGTVRSCRLFRLKDGRSQGQGIVEYETDEGAHRCVTELKDAMVDGRSMLVRFNDGKPGMEKRESTGNNNASGGKVIKTRANTAKPADKATSETSKILYVHNLPFTTTEQSVQDLFADYGTVDGVALRRMHDGKSRGQGWVRFPSHESAVKAMNAMQDVELDGRIIGLKLHTGSEPAGLNNSNRSRKVAVTPRKQASIVPARKMTLSSQKRGKKSSDAPSDGAQRSRLFLGNVSTETPAEYLRQLFRECGPCTLTIHKTRHNRGKNTIGWAQFRNTNEAQRAIEMYDGATIDGEKVTVDWAKDQTRENEKDTNKGIQEPKLRFSNVPNITPEEFIRSIFTEYGSCDLKLHTNKQNESLGKGTVQYDTLDVAKTAYQALGGAIVDGQPMEIAWADGNTNSRNQSQMPVKKRVSLSQTNQPPAKRARVDAGEKGGGKSLFPANGMTCYFHNCSPTTEEATLRTIFGRMGFCQVVLNRMQNGRSRGSGWVLYRTPAHAEKAIHTLDDHEIDGANMAVMMHRD